MVLFVLGSARFSSRVGSSTNEMSTGKKFSRDSMREDSEFADVTLVEQHELEDSGGREKFEWHQRMESQAKTTGGVRSILRHVAV